jgi:hypothetical protein
MRSLLAGMLNCTAPDDLTTTESVRSVVWDACLAGLHIGLFRDVDWVGFMTAESLASNNSIAAIGVRVTALLGLHALMKSSDVTRVDVFKAARLPQLLLDTLTAQHGVSDVVRKQTEGLVQYSLARMSQASVRVTLPQVAVLFRVHLYPPCCSHSASM